MTTPTPIHRLQALTTGRAAALFHELHDPARRGAQYLANDVHLEDCPSRTLCTLDPAYQARCICPEAVTVVVIRRPSWPTTAERHLPGDWDDTGA